MCYCRVADRDPCMRETGASDVFRCVGGCVWGCSVAAVDIADVEFELGVIC